MFSTLMMIVATAGYADAPAESVRPESLDVNPLRVVECNIIQYTNIERIMRGLPPLEIDPKLIESARRHATWMTNARSMTHSSGPVAENIAAGQPTTAAAMRAWMNSPGHRANILSRGYTKMGAAAFISPSGTIYWCQQFLK